MAGVLASVAVSETEVRKERRLAGIAKEGRGQALGRQEAGHSRQAQGGEALIGHLHGQGKPVGVIARMVGLTRRTVYKALERQPQDG